MPLVADDLLKTGIAKIQYTTDDDRRFSYYEGKHNGLFTPHGITSAEYHALEKMAHLPLIRLAVRTPCQRLRSDGIRISGKGTEQLALALNSAWRYNKMTSKQRLVYVHGLVFGYGVVSVWPNANNKARPTVRVESPQNLAIVYRDDDPSVIDYVVKLIETEADILLDKPAHAKAWVYTDAMVRVYEGENTGDLQLVNEFPNPLDTVPFVVFAPEANINGPDTTFVDALIPQQRAIDTMRFNLMLAAQFAAFRQRIVTGFDPARRDADDNIINVTDPDTGEEILDDDGNPQPIIDSPGSVGVDRMLVFPGTETKVIDLEESDLNNYVIALDMLVASFASTAQVPPQYLVGDFKNVSGDLMTATEATLRSFVSDLQIQYGDGWLGVYDLISKAAGLGELPLEAQVVWANAEPQSLTQVSSAASQMIPNGAPLRMFLEMLSQNPDQVDSWLADSQNAMNRLLGGDLAAGEFGVKPQDDEETNDK